MMKGGHAELPSLLLSAPKPPRSGNQLRPVACIPEGSLILRSLQLSCRQREMLYLLHRLPGPCCWILDCGKLGARIATSYDVEPIAVAPVLSYFMLVRREEHRAFGCANPLYFNEP